MTFTAQEALQRTIDHREIFYDEMLSLMRQIMALSLIHISEPTRPY